MWFIHLHGLPKSFYFYILIHWNFSWPLNNSGVRGTEPQAVENLQLILILPALKLSLRNCGGLVPGPAVNAKMCRHSSPLYKMGRSLHTVCPLQPQTPRCRQKTVWGIYWKKFTYKWSHSSNSCYSRANYPLNLGVSSHSSSQPYFAPLLRLSSVSC